MAIWVKDLNKDNFKVCFRETKILDGLHKDMHHSGLKRDAASIWIEDVTQSSCKVCLRELQNYAGSHKDISVVSM